MKQEPKKLEVIYWWKERDLFKAQLCYNRGIAEIKTFKTLEKIKKIAQEHNAELRRG